MLNCSLDICISILLNLYLFYFLLQFFLCKEVFKILRLKKNKISKYLNFEKAKKKLFLHFFPRFGISFFFHTFSSIRYKTIFQPYILLCYMNYVVCYKIKKDVLINNDMNSHRLAFKFRTR